MALFMKRKKIMARSFLTLFTISIFCTILAIGVFANPPTADAEKAELVSKLAQRADRLERRAQGTKGVPRAHLQQQSLRLKNLIKRLEAGESIDPQEIDTLLQQGGY
jgi:hypothetical protein